jgi:hypothetical protein
MFDMSSVTGTTFLISLAYRQRRGEKARYRRRCIPLQEHHDKGKLRRVPKAMSVRIALAFACLLALACESHDLEVNFFKQPLANRVERLRQYPLADQYKIFRYGNDRKEPPFMDLANPIAERGTTAIPFLLNQLNSHADDITTRDILLIFERMASSGTYDVQSDDALMTTLNSKVSGMKDKDWQAICLKKLQRIKDYN